MMNRILGIRDFISNVKLPRSVNLNKGATDSFIIRMKNQYLDEKGEVIKWQKLVTEYERIVDEEITNFCVLTNIKVNKAVFESSNKNAMNWTFVEGLEIPYFLLSSNTPQEIEVISKEEVFGKISKQVVKFSQSFKKFPKTASVYLYVMQVYDLIAFENFASYFSSLELTESTVGQYKEIDMLSDSKAQIGLGMYSESSSFINGTFKAAYLGVTSYKNRECVIYSYICDKSGVRIEDDKMSSVRKGNSYYSGTLFVDLNNFTPVYGSMIENYIAKQNGVNINVRREVHMELKEEENNV